MECHHVNVTSVTAASVQLVPNFGDITSTVVPSLLDVSGLT